jgi:hypothetical protein
MRNWKNLLAAAIVAWPALAVAAPGDGEATLEEIQQNATFCEGTYALCIKAPYVAIPTLDRLGHYVTDHAACSCEVVQGWSMGPGACVDRGPVKQHGQTYLISTYSNLFNRTPKNGLNNTLTCSDASTVWAWCYGAPCVVDPNDPHKASCNCPLKQSAMSTLGGSCQTGSCSSIWSAALPKGDTFANEHFASYMKSVQPPVPYNPPAQACVQQ